MRPDFILQKIFLGAAIGAALLGIALPVFVMGLGLKLPPAAGWLTVLALPFIAGIAILSSLLFLTFRLIQKDGLGTPAIVLAALIVLAVPVSLGVLWISTQASRDPVREGNQHRLTTLASTQPAAFFELIDSIAPLDKTYFDQVQSLLISKGFIRADPDLVHHYFKSGTKHLPTGSWIPKCLLAGLEEAASNPSPEAFHRIRAVLEEVRSAYPVAFSEPFEYSGLTNTFDNIARQRASNRFIANPDRFRTNLLQLIEPAKTPPRP